MIIDYKSKHNKKKPFEKIQNYKIYFNRNLKNIKKQCHQIY